MGKIKTENFAYTLGDMNFRAYLAQDETVSGKRPGVLVVHEAWGVGEHTIERAQRLAELGYVALAVDMFGDGKQPASNPEAMQWIGALRNDVPTLRARMRAAFDALAALPQVDEARIASIGFCFGGSASLELARSGASAAGIVSFHGNLSTTMPAQPDTVTAQILICIGKDDPFVPSEQVDGFVEEMTNAEVSFKMIIYTGAKHSFTNPKASERGIPGVEYNKQADEASWKAMREFFDEIFAPAEVAA